jgi:hypothetical protein
MHKFAQHYAPIFIDAQVKREYRARQIEPKSLETLRLSFEGGAA